MISLTEINAMPPAEFEQQFSDIAEHSPWVARHAASSRPFVSRQKMVDAFRDAVLAASETAQLQLLRAHPDLAGKAKLTDASKKEQAGAGLDTLTQEEMARFTHLNDLYKSRFDFPFIFAVKGAGKHDILNAFAERVNNSTADEFQTALDNVARIFRFRIEDRVAL